MGLTKDIEKAIKANLSGATADALKDFIEESKTNASNLKKKEKELDIVVLDLKEACSQIEELRVFKNREKLIEQEELRLETLEKDLNQGLFDVQLKFAVLEEKEKNVNQRVSDHQLMFSTVFRNTVLRENVMNSVLAKSPDMMQSGYNNDTVVVNGGESLLSKTDTKKTTEE